MRIGIDCRTVDPNGSGVGQYGAHLVKALGETDSENEYVLLRPQGRILPFWTPHVAMRRVFDEARFDLIHLPGGAAPYGYRKPYVVTVHDLAIYTHPEWFPGGQWFSTRVSYPSTMKNARRIIVPSEATKRDVMELFKIDEKKIDVIAHGVSLQDMGSLRTARDDERYILSLGTIEPRKNIEMLVAAYRQMIDVHPDLRSVELRIAGAVGWKAGPIIRAVETAVHDGYAVTMLGRVPEAEKWRLLAGASCFVAPSLFEGFDMPVLEAMAAGTPVILSDIPVHREVAGDAACYFDTTGIGSLARLLTRVISDKNTADELREKGIARAKGFSWVKTAEKTVETYRAAIA